MLRTIISNEEKDLMDVYISDYALENSDKKADIDYVLRIWAENKAKYLNNLFGNKLILEKEICYEKDVDQMTSEINDLLSNSNDTEEFMREYFNELICSDKHSNVAYGLRALITPAALARNIYNGEAFSIVTPDDKEIKVPNGCKITRVLGKIAEAYDLPCFEEFRIAHSMVLNQKKMSGTLCISIHPMDYMTMSDNYCDWSSCMSWQEDGCYRQGTVEMMNSEMVIVAYLKSSSNMRVPKGTWNSKKWRELFIVNPQIITNVKSYPYKNDYLTTEVLTWLKELADAANFGNYDTETTKFNIYDSSEEVARFAEKDIRIRPYTSMMYNDFGSECGQIAYIGKDIEGKYSFCYSGPSECMCCGSIEGEFDEESALCCDECREIEYCSCCGDRIEHDGDDYQVDGENFCCHDCYEESTCECAISGDIYLKSNCIEINVAAAIEKPLEDRVVDEKIDRMEIGCSYTNFRIHKDYYAEAEERFSKIGKIHKDLNPFSVMYYIRIDEVTENFVDALGYENVEALARTLN